MRTRFVHLAILLLPAWTGACAAGPSPRIADPETQVREAVAELEREGFEEATPRLEAVVSTCTDDPHGRRALLLLAATQLDPGNPGGSPEAAARLSRRYLALQDLTPDERIVARALLRAAAQAERVNDLVAVVERSEGRQYLEPCAPTDPDAEGARGAPSEVVRASWAHMQEAAVMAIRTRIGELQAEIDRITDLLTTDATRGAQEPGR